MKACKPFIKMLPINLRVSLCLPLRFCTSGLVRFAKLGLLPNFEARPAVEGFEKTALNSLFADGAFSHCGGFANVGYVGIFEQ